MKAMNHLLQNLLIKIGWIKVQHHHVWRLAAVKDDGKRLIERCIICPELRTTIHPLRLMINKQIVRDRENTR